MSPYHIALHIGMKLIERKHHFEEIIAVRGVCRDPFVLHFPLHVVCPGMDDRRHLYIWGKV